MSDAVLRNAWVSRDAYERLGLSARGMEFAIEMVIKASNRNCRITEIPVTLHVDGRSGPPHLRSFRDGWRTLRLLLLHVPDYLYVIPGSLFFVVGAILRPYS